MIYKSSEQWLLNPYWLLILRDYTTPYIGDYNDKGFSIKRCPDFQGRSMISMSIHKLGLAVGRETLKLLSHYLV